MEVTGDPLAVFDHPKAGDLRDGTGVFECEARLLCEALEQRNVSRSEAGAPCDPTDRQNSRSARPERKRHQDHGADARDADHRLRQGRAARVVDDHRLLRPDHLGGQRTGKRHDDVFQFVRSDAVGDEDAQGPTLWDADGGHIRVAEFSRVLGNQLQCTASGVAGQERRGHLADRIQPSFPQVQLRIELRIGNGHAGLGSEDDDSRLVILGEFRLALLVGEVNVAEDAAMGANRSAEKGPHGRVVGRETRCTRVLRDVPESKDGRLTDQQAEDAPTMWELADGRPLLRHQPAGDEVCEVDPIGGEHPDGAVARIGHLHREIDDALKQRGERELCRQGEAGFKQTLGAAATQYHPAGS